MQIKILHIHLSQLQPVTAQIRISYTIEVTSVQVVVRIAHKIKLVKDNITTVILYLKVAYISSKAIW